MKRALLLAMTASVAAACDPLATGGFRPPYVTINGTIDQSSTMPVVPEGSTLRVALLWQNDQTPGVNYSEQLVDVTAHFPAKFSVDIAARPKSQVINSVPSDSNVARTFGLDPQMRWATATLVVYADDGDGKLTLVDSGTSRDRVLAATSDLDLFLLAAGKPAPSSLIGLFPVTAGFSLVTHPTRDPKPGECGKFTTEGHFSDLCPNVDALPSPIDPASLDERLELIDSADLQRFTCSSFWGAHEYPEWVDARATDICDGGACKFCRGYQCPLDLPQAGDIVTCSSDNLSYVYKRCVDDASLCGTRFCHFGHGERLAADPPPTGWPCN